MGPGKMIKKKEKKKTDWVLKISHSTRFNSLFQILEVVSIILIILGLTLFLLQFIDITYQKYQLIIPIILGAGILGIIPATSIRGRNNGFRLFNFYFLMTLILVTIRFGNLINDIELYYSNSGQVINTHILNPFYVVFINSYLLYLVGLSAIISFSLTYLIWGFEFSSHIEDSLIIGSYLSAGILLNYMAKNYIFSLTWFIAFLILSILIGLILGKYDKGDVEYIVFTDLILSFSLIIIFVGIPVGVIYDIFNYSFNNTLINVISDFAILLSFFIGSWISIIAVQHFIKNKGSNPYISLLSNVLIGSIFAIILIIQYSQYLNGPFGLFSFLINLSDLLGAVLIFFIVSFVASMIFLIVFGSSNYKFHPLLVEASLLLIQSFYSIIKNPFIPAVLFISTLVISDSILGNELSDVISKRYLKGKSLLEKNPQVKTPTNRVSDNRPPYCWEKSKSLEGYVILRALPVRGGFGYVLEGYDPSSKRRVAIKVLKEAAEDGTPIAFDAQTLNKFNEEHEKLKNLKGIKNIVSIFDTHLPEIERYSGSNRLEAYIRSPPYIVMEFLTGGSLSDINDLFVRPEYIRPFLLIIYSIAGGLYEAHSKGILHGDIKPDNILFASIGKYTVKTESSDPVKFEKSLLRGYLIPKITDFGTAKVMNTGRTTFSTATINYAPSEILVSQNVIDQRYDVYELGMLMYYELSGVAGSPEKTLEFNKRQAQISQFINQGKFFEKLEDVIPILEKIELNDVRKINTGVSEKLWLFIKRAIDPNPIKRPKNMKEFATAIKIIAISDYGLNEIESY